jgi:hypothetical protein
MFHGSVSPAIARGLKTLRERIALAKIPSSKLDETLNIATWNVREFGKVRRSEAAIHYIAEIIGQFDIVGLVELRDNLADLARVMPILGPTWKAIYSDAILDPGGNRERVCYVFDQRAVTFNGLAAEASAPRKKKGKEYLPETSWWRAPYVASFSAGNFDFLLFTTHVRWGDDLAARRDEIQGLANWIEAKMNEPHAEDKDIIVMGDFNIDNRADALFKALTSRGLKLPKALLTDAFGSNLARDKRYDQIVHSPQFPDTFTNAGGVLDFYRDNHKPLLPDLDKQAFTFQLSDHLPLWLQINTDIDGFELNQLIRGHR